MVPFTQAPWGVWVMVAWRGGSGYGVVLRLYDHAAMLSVRRQVFHARRCSTTGAEGGPE